MFDDNALKVSSNEMELVDFRTFKQDIEVSNVLKSCIKEEE